MAKSITINGTEYSSSVKAAQALVADGQTVAQAMKVLHEAGSDITYSSVYAYTKGAEKTASRRVRYRILNLGKTGRKTASEIAEKTGTSTPKVVAMLKKAGIAITTKEALAKAEASKNADKKSSKKTKKTRKAKKVEEVTPEINEKVDVPATEDQVVEKVDNN